MDKLRQLATAIRGKDKSQGQVDSQPVPQEDAASTSVFSPIFSYFYACRDVKTVEEWLRINQQQTGSQILYADEVGTGALVGYAAGFALRRALKIGAVVVGVGFLTLQVTTWWNRCVCALIVRRLFEIHRSETSLEGTLGTREPINHYTLHI